MNEIKNPMTIAGITFSKDAMKDWRENFEEYRRDDCEVALVSKKVYIQGEDDNEPFNRLKYRYVIKGVSGNEYGYEKEPGVPGDYYQAYLVPTPDCLAPSELKSVLSFVGLEDEPDLLNVVDIVEYGHGVCLGSEVIEAKDEWDEELLNGFATALETIDAMRGFYLDRRMNGLGMTGGNFLEMALEGKGFNDFMAR